VNIQLFFTDKSSDPVITQLARELDINFSIVLAKLEDFRSDIYGSLVINVNEEDRDKVLDYLTSREVVWEVL
jgi:D-methionine transport system ATP-binding protein